MKRYYYISWHRDLGPGRGETGDSLDEKYKTKKEAIQEARRAFNSWGTRGDPDYVGVWWEVTKVENEDGEMIYATRKCK